MVRVAAPPVAPVMFTGLVEPKLKVGGYLAPAGLEATEAVSAAPPVKPPEGVNVIVEVLPVVAPGATLTGVPMMEKLGKSIVYVAVATALVEPPPAVAIASIVSVDETVIGPLYTVEPVVGVDPLVV